MKTAKLLKAFNNLLDDPKNMDATTFKTVRTVIEDESKDTSEYRLAFNQLLNEARTAQPLNKELPLVPYF